MHIHRKWLTLTTAAAAAMMLAACGQLGHEIASDATETYNYIYSDDPVSFDYTVTYRTSDSDHLTNFVEGLLERDQYGKLKPAVAKAWRVSKDGLTYTYQLKKDLKWVDASGKPYATVKAQDFVTGLKHAVEAKSETLSVVQNSIKGLADYTNGKINDFNQVGVKALDDNTVQYTLVQPEPYLNSKLTYGVMYPVNAKFLAAKGTKFGQVKADGILYNGPYLLDEYAKKKVITYKQNPAYWDKKNVHITQVKETYDDGSQPDEQYRAFQRGELSAARLSPKSANFKLVKKNSSKNIIWSAPDSTTYNFTFNLDRRSYRLTNKVSTKAKQDTRKAILNQKFRQAIQAAFDKTEYNEQKSGKVGGVMSLRNMMTPYDFVDIDNRPYGEAVARFLTHENPTVFKNVNLQDQQDGTYNAVQARVLFAAAKRELQAKGVSFPVHLDLPQPRKNDLISHQNKAFKTAIETALGQANVVVDIQETSEAKYNAATYNVTTGAQSDYDLAHATGWAPDYDDPAAYLSIYNTTDGAFLKNLGLDNVTSGKPDATAAVKQQIGLEKYDALLDQAMAITADDNARYTAFAKAEAWLLNASIMIPVSSGGGVPAVTRSYQMAQPATRPYVQSGLGDKSFKYVKLQKDVISTAKYHQVKQRWNQVRDLPAHNQIASSKVGPRQTSQSALLRH